MNETRYDAAAYDYDLPPELIAQEPAKERDGSRLLVIDREREALTHSIFRELPSFLSPGDLLVLNDTRVMPARAYGRRATGGKVEILFLRDLSGGRWEALLRCNGILREGEWVPLANGRLRIRLLQRRERGAWVVAVPRGLVESLDRVGVMPLPPYIRRTENDPRSSADRDRYQTIYAVRTGAVAAPTAGLHFTSSVFEGLKARGIAWTFVTLHVGAGTFRPIAAEDIRRHRLHREAFSIGEEAAKAIQAARERGGRIVAVGTTSCRVLETAARDGLAASSGETDLYIVPPYSFRLTDAIVTNFHLPRSTLLVMICAFAGRERILAAYRECQARGYRFYSYGDAMLIL